MFAGPPPWVDAVWSGFQIPKCSFNLWLVLQGRLLTKDRMRGFHLHADPGCILCGRALESHDHLFGSCSFSSFVINSSGFSFTGCWASYRNGRFLLGRYSPLRRDMALLFLAVAFYLIWREINSRIHNPGSSRPASSILVEAKRMFREKLFSSRKFQRAVRNDSSLVDFLY